jgi:PAS domain-containing protein
MSDIEEHKSTERQMRELVAIVESSDDAIVSKTLEGIVTSWNKGAERLFGYRAEEIIGEPVARLIPEDRLEEECRFSPGCEVANVSIITKRCAGAKTAAWSTCP